jgi:curved DNA-binding protein CbpA
MSLEPATVFLEERSLYSVLGVNPEATKEQIEKAYKVMSQ